VASPPSVVLSPRNAEKAAELHREFPTLTRMAADNQAVVDVSDVVFIATPPGVERTRALLEPITFRADQTVICLISGVNATLLAALCAPVPPASIVQAFPLPPAAEHHSTTLMTPPNAVAEAILGQLGKVIPTADFASAMKIMAITCCMGDFYAHLRACHEWLQTNGIDSATASSAVGAFFDTFNAASQDSSVGFDHLVAEQTPGGMNEQVIAELTAAGNYENVKRALDNLLPRLLG
jgi:pyrroline-5-carboxylate reductase